MATTATPAAPSLFECTPAPPPDLRYESDGGIVCHLRKVWAEINVTRQSIARDWPSCRAKTRRLEEEDRHLAVIAEAGKRLKAHVCKTPGGADVVGEEGF